MVYAFLIVCHRTLVVRCMRFRWFHLRNFLVFLLLSIPKYWFAFFLLLASPFPQEVKFFICENSSTTFTERDAIAEVETRGCYAQQRQAYTVNFLVPPTPPTDSTSSKIVHVSYHLLVSVNLITTTKIPLCTVCKCTMLYSHADMHIQLPIFFSFFHGNKIEGLTGCFHLNPTIKIPITIGSYPILDHLPNYINSIAPAVSNEIALRQQPTAQSTAERAPQSQSTIFPPSAPYPENGLLNSSHFVLSNLNINKYFDEKSFTMFFFLSSGCWTDPPSYEQATTIGERKFAPNYPVYRRQTSYSSQNSTPVLQRHCNQWRNQPKISPNATIAIVYTLHANPFYSNPHYIES